MNIIKLDKFKHGKKAEEVKCDIEDILNIIRKNRKGLLRLRKYNIIHKHIMDIDEIIFTLEDHLIEANNRIKNKLKD